MLIGSIALFFAAILFFAGFLLPSPSVTMAQQTEGATTTPPMTTTPSLTPITPLLTSEEQQQQVRLQNVIASTTANLQETQKQANGIVFTPRWSNPVWINANSVSVLIAYCLPGEFADAGQEILGGFELEVLESYAIALPQGFMAWMAVVGNEDLQNRRLPAALGVICASDLNNAEARILSPQEQQGINNINQQFVSIQNTQITDIDNVINIINNVTAVPPRNETGGVTEQPLTVEIIISNEVEQPTYTEFLLEANVTDGTAPYFYDWVNDTHLSSLPDNMMQVTVSPGATRIVTVIVTDSNNQTASDSIKLVREPPECRLGSFYNATSGQCESRFSDVIGNTTIVEDTTPPVFYGGYSQTIGHDNPNGRQYNYDLSVQDNVDAQATLTRLNELIQDDVGGDISIECNPPPGSLFPIGTTTVQCTAVDQAGNEATHSFTITIVLEVEPLPPGEIPTGPREQPEEVSPSPPTEPQPEPTPEPEPEPEPEPGPPPQEEEQGEEGGGGGTDAESPSE